MSTSNQFYEKASAQSKVDNPQADCEQVTEILEADIDTPTKTVVTSRNTRPFIYTEERQRLLDLQQKLKDRTTALQTQIDSLDAKCGPGALAQALPPSSQIVPPVKKG